jgi:hypothetical protein
MMNDNDSVETPRFRVYENMNFDAALRLSHLLGTVMIEVFVDFAAAFASTPSYDYSLEQHSMSSSTSPLRPQRMKWREDNSHSLMAH